MICASVEAVPEQLKQICNMAEKETFFPEHVEDFGVKLDKKPMEAEGRVLPTPEMVDGSGQIDVIDGEWRVDKYYEGVKASREKTDEDNWEEKFKTHEDSRPRGPESV